MSTQSKSRWFYQASLRKEIESGPGGVLRSLTSNQLSGLSRLSLIELTLKPNGLLNPTWHPNAHKIGYCTQGRMLVSMHGPMGGDQFLVEEGEIFYLPQGSIHHIENPSDEDGVIKFALNHEDPSIMTLAQSFSVTADEVLKPTFAIDSDFINGLKNSTTHDLLGIVPHASSGTGATSHRNKFDLERSAKAVLSPGGYLQVGLKVNLPILDGLGILGFGLTRGGAVEPHWHPNSDELVYVTKGQIRGMLLSPDGHHEVHELGAGEGFFAPAGYYHSISNSGEGDMQGIAFFNNAESNYVGIGETLGAFSNEVLGSTFNVDPDYFEDLKKPAGPLVVVPS